MKKIVILQIRRHYGELDWIFPILYLLKKKKFKIVTYFDDYNSYFNLTNNKLLHNKWQKLNSDFYIQKKIDKFFFKIIFKIILNLGKKFKSLIFLAKFLDIISLKLYNVNEILRKNQIENFKLFFCSNNNYSNLYKLFKQKNRFIKIIRFPTSQHVRYFNKKNLIDKKVMFGDKYLFRFKDEADMYFGSNKNKYYSENKVIFCGNVKYEKWWLDKLFKNNFKNKNKELVVLVATRGFFTEKENERSKIKILSDQSFKYMINSIMKLENIYKDIKFIFKTHPSNKEYFLLKKILSNYKKLNWKIDHNHASILIQHCNLGIVFLSSVCLDIIAMKKPVIEFWINTKDNHGLIKKGNNFFTTYQLNKLVKHVESFNDLSKNIKFLNNKSNYNKTIKLQYKNFLRVNKLNKYNSRRVIDQIL